ncbi:F0F1 ATP synthase subunit gamma [Legionella sp. PATHC038]|uniref:F0F1 ATP synthase subunit gamma n=1 Tax=Legionella sheltonii TaxID=2992041 RepID=UPI0022438D74|nr:F0F1 ATP synthase subunit gamma [Legionella sp. PATHC038]MCW8399437.1 F0F1 ATP synthase subunit gamma [Legionella sp. PATHC038]
MSDTTASLHRKITGAEELQSVVRTMKALAAASIGQYEKSVQALTDYYHALELGLSVCFRDMKLKVGQVKEKTGVGEIGAVVFGSDQGLVGQFNDLVAEYAFKTLSVLPGTLHVWAVGERVYGRMNDIGLPLCGLFSVPNSIKAISPLVEQILIESAIFHDDIEINELYLFYNRHVTGAVYQPTGQRLLPLDEQWRYQLSQLPWPTKKLPQILGDRTTTLRALIREYLFVSLFRACAESLASENASRLISMQRADKNIDELLELLNRTFHRFRQEKIDEELFDVISGFEALCVPKGSK